MNRFRLVALFLFFLLFQSNIFCLSPLGRNENLEWEQRSMGIKECGLATSIKQSWDFRKVDAKGNNFIFTDSVKEIFWFAEFSFSGLLKNQVPRSFRIQWIAPDQTIFHEEKFKTSFWNESLVKRSINLDSKNNEKYIGIWRVKVWRKDTLIEDLNFRIVKTD